MNDNVRGMELSKNAGALGKPSPGGQAMGLSGQVLPVAEATMKRGDTSNLRASVPSSEHTRG